MEVAGLVLSIAGTVGVLGQLLDGCLKAYRVFTAVSNLGRDSERLLCKIKIEEMRLAVWGREWGVAEGDFEQSLAAGAANEGLRSLAELLLTQLYETIMDLNKLQGKYGLQEAAPGSVDAAAYRALLARGRHDGGLRLRARWVISDKDKFAAFLADLQFYNDRLERLFPPARVGTLHRAWTAGLLDQARRDLPALDLLQAAAKPSYPALGTFAELKQLQINLDARQPSTKILSSSELKVPLRRVRLHDGDAGDDDAQQRRSRATYQRPGAPGAAHTDVDVLVEWTHVDAALDAEQRCHAYQRVDNLARMLHSSSNRHPDLHTLDCLGYVEDAGRARYGMLYVLPAGGGGAHSLDALIAGPAATPDLDARFRLAHTLAVALWACHSLDWLHKTLCPRNVLFFGPDVRAPFLAGFDSSRPDHLDEMSAAPRQMLGEELYRHPASLGPHRSKYCKAFDVYSLGLVLLEVGLWRGLDAFHRGKAQRYAPAAFRDKVVQGLVPALGAKTGSTYRDLVHRCLVYKGPEEAEAEGAKGPALSPHQMMESVVQSLDSLNV